jgi:hypothetical protein
MATTIRQIRRCVQKIAKKARLTSEETKLATDCITAPLPGENRGIYSRLYLPDMLLPHRCHKEHIHEVEVIDPD